MDELDELDATAATGEPDEWERSAATRVGYLMPDDQNQGRKRPRRRDEWDRAAAGAAPEEDTEEEEERESGPDEEQAEETHADEGDVQGAAAEEPVEPAPLLSRAAALRRIRIFLGPLRRLKGPGLSEQPPSAHGPGAGVGLGSPGAEAPAPSPAEEASAADVEMEMGDADVTGAQEGNGAPANGNPPPAGQLAGAGQVGAIVPHAAEPAAAQPGQDGLAGGGLALAPLVPPVGVAPNLAVARLAVRPLAGLPLLPSSDPQMSDMLELTEHASGFANAASAVLDVLNRTAPGQLKTDPAVSRVSEKIESTPLLGLHYGSVRALAKELGVSRHKLVTTTHHHTATWVYLQSFELRGALESLEKDTLRVRGRLLVIIVRFRGDETPMVLTLCDRDWIARIPDQFADLKETAKQFRSIVTQNSRSRGLAKLMQLEWRVAL
jgi:hypothetical protein